MKIAFFGTPRFARIALETMWAAGVKPDLIVANPDRPVGRKKIVTPPPTKEFGALRSVRVLQPEKIKELEADLRAEQWDLFIVAAYAQIIPQSILSIPKWGTIGIHPSLLPKWRGSSPIQTALLSGDEITGVTIYELDYKMDHGPILARVEHEISSEEGYLELESCLAELGGNLAARVVAQIETGSVTREVQDESLRTFTTKFSTNDAFIEPSDLKAALSGDDTLARNIHNKVRALNPEPGVWTMENGKRLKILRTNVRGGALVLLRTQQEGGVAKELA